MTTAELIKTTGQSLERIEAMLDYAQTLLDEIDRNANTPEQRAFEARLRHVETELVAEALEVLAA